MTIKIASKNVGSGESCFIVAEIGINHNGDMDLARDMIQAAASAGADSVKFQNYRTEDFISDHTLTYSYLNNGKEITESQFDMFKRCELSFEQLKAMKDICDQCGVIFHSTPTSEDGIRDVVRLGAPLLKNGSDYLGNIPLIRTMARTGLPTVLSTGMATLADVDEAVRAYRDAGGKDLVLLHCTSSYPTPSTEVHLRKMQTLAAAFGCPVGFSDHTDGVEAAIGAVALGACFVEKHFTTNRALPGPDHRFSSDQQEFASLVKSIRRIEKNLGTGIIGPADSEKMGRINFRLSCVAAHDIAAGHIITEKDIAFRRPGNGLAPNLVSWLIGMQATKQISRGDVFSVEHFKRDRT